jgi:hypothetical protein
MSINNQQQPVNDFILTVFNDGVLKLKKVIEEASDLEPEDEIYIPSSEEERGGGDTNIRE